MPSRMMAMGVHASGDTIRRNWDTADVALSRGSQTPTATPPTVPRVTAIPKLTHKPLQGCGKRA